MVARPRSVAMAEPPGEIPAAELVADYPGPAALLDRAGEVAAANPLAAPLLERLARNPGLAALAAVRAPTLETVEFPGRDGPATVELAILPGAAGTLLLGRDVSLTANMRAALVDSRTRYKELVEISSDFAWEVDAAGRFAFVSPRGALGLPAAALLGREAAGLLHVDPDCAGDPELLPESPFATRAPLEQAEFWLDAADGGTACVTISAVPLFDAAGVWRGVRGVWRDVTQDRARDTALAEARNRERMLAHLVRVLRDDGEPLAVLSAAAKAATRTLGAEGGRIYRLTGGNRQAAAAGFGDGVPSELDECVGRFTEALALDMSARPVAFNLPGGKALAVVASHRRARHGALAVWRGAEAPDWSEGERRLIEEIGGQLGIALAQIEHQEHLGRLARTDGLTGLLNAATFRRLVERRMDAARAGRRGLALVYVDLDNFKLVNDRFGHDRGDALLRMVADGLQRVVRAGDAVGRLGGDEFALLLEGIAPANADGFAGRVLALQAELAAFSGDPARPVGLSLGIAFADLEGEETVDALVARADAAMYRAKRAGKGRHAVSLPGGRATEE